MSLRLLNLLHTQRLLLLEESEAATGAALDEETWLTPHTDLLDAYADLGLGLLDEDTTSDDRRSALRHLIDLAFAAGYRAAGTDAHPATTHLPGPLPQEPEEEDSDVSDPVPAL